MAGTDSYSVRTDAVRRLAADLAARTPPDGRARLHRVLDILVEPLRRLTALERLVTAAGDCDPTARRQLLRYLRTAAVDDRRPVREPGRHTVSSGAPTRAASFDENLFDESDLNALASALAAIAFDERPALAVDAGNVVLDLAGGGRYLSAIVAAHQIGGADATIQQMRSGSMPGMPGDLQEMIDGLDFGPDDIGSPGFEFPDIDTPDFGVPHFDRDWFDDLFPPVDDPFDDLWTDPDEWEPIPPWWKYPRLQEDIPPGLAALIACLRTVAKLIEERAALAPPSPGSFPYGMVWADQITSLVPGARCPGDVLIVSGTGFDALRSIAVLILPTAAGCRAVAVDPGSWTDTQIFVTLPTDVVSGPVGFADRAYVTAWNEWHDDQERRLAEIRAYTCGALAGDVAESSPFSVCAPNLGRNYLTAGAAIIDAFRANGLGRAVVTPGATFTLTWSARNCSAVEVTRTSTVGPAFPGSVTMVGPPTGSITVGPFGASSPQDAVYELTARGPCGTVTASATVAVRKTPRLRVTGVEFTQAIQAFGPFAALNSASPLAAGKDTIARVYVTHDLDSYLLDGTHGVAVSGRLRVNGIAVPPLNVAQALPSEGWVNRGATEHSLNFRIPAGRANGVAAIGVTVWTNAEFEQPPGGDLLRPTATFSSSVTWTQRRALRLRYVRVSTPTMGALSDADCREIIVRAHDLLPAPPTDIAPARMPTWHTSYNPATSDGKQTLLDHLDDQHDCTLSEAIFPWEDDCPPGDGAIWVGVIPVPGGGLAQSHRVWAPGRNTLVAQADRVVVAHEIGHTQKLNHVNPGVECGSGGPDGDYDTLPLGGGIAPADAFDPHNAVSVPFPGGPLYDMMTYACNRWISRANWQRLFDKFS